MIQIVYHRKKCIGCNYCVELAPERWHMNPKDGKSVLIGSKNNKKGIYTTKVNDDEFEVNQSLAKVCPVKIIKINRLHK